MVFYGEAVLILIVALLWMTLVANRPSEHYFINDKELQHIEKALGASVSKEKVLPMLHIHIVIDEIDSFINFSK